MGQSESVARNPGRADALGKIKHLLRDGAVCPDESRWRPRLIWATSRHSADFAHQVETLNADVAFRDARPAESITTVCGIILRRFWSKPARGDGMA